jgi:hypothetical protein
MSIAPSLITRILLSHVTQCESGSSISVVSDYELNDRAIEIRTPVEAYNFFF